MITRDELVQPVTTRIVRHALPDHRGVPMPVSTLSWWINREPRKGERMIVPLLETGRGESNVFSVQQVLALGAAKAAKAAGHSADLAAHIGAYIAEMLPTDVEAAFGRGETIVMAAQVAGNVHVFPRLMKAAEIDAAEVDELRKSAREGGIVASFCAVDLRPLLEQLTARLAKQEKERAAEKKKRRKRKK